MTEPYKQLDVPALILEFQTATDCSPLQAQRWIGKYIKLTAAELIRHTDREPRDKCNAEDQPEDRIRIPISANSINRGLGHILIQGQRRQILPIINQLKSRLWTILTGDLGNNTQGKLSMATLHYDYEDIVMASGDHQELYKLVYAEHQADIAAGNYDEVEIDLASLNNFIQSSRADLAEGSLEQSYRERVTRNLKEAVRIKLLAEANNGRLVQVKSSKPSIYGREYYVGPNLQSVSKIVRHAALGHCHEIDLSTAVFSWRLAFITTTLKFLNPECSIQHIAKEIKPDVKLTTEYVEYKDQVRNRITRDVFGELLKNARGHIDTTSTKFKYYRNIVKDAMTAIGFGATLTTSRGYLQTGDGDNSDGWRVPALPSIIRSRNYLDKFITNPEVMTFYQEQKAITSLIIDFLKMDEFQELNSEIRSHPDLVDSKGNLRANRVMSYLYQNEETRIRRDMISICEERGFPVILSVHDSIYTKNMAATTIQDLKTEIDDRFKERVYGQGRHWHHPTYFRISHTVIKGYNYTDKSESLEHARLTQEDENRAAALAGKTPQDIMNRILNRDRNLPGAVYEPEVDYNRQANDGSGYNQPRWQPDWDLDDQGNEIADEPIIIVGRQWPPAQGAPGQQ